MGGSLLVPWVATVAAVLAIAGGCCGRSRVLEYVARRSYGLYLWHHPLLVLLLPRVHGAAHWPVGVLLVGVSFACAEASWRFVEAPVLRRGRTGPNDGRAPDPEVEGSSVRRPEPADA